MVEREGSWKESEEQLLSSRRDWDCGIEGGGGGTYWDGIIGQYQAISGKQLSSVEMIWDTSYIIYHISYHIWDDSNSNNMAPVAACGGCHHQQ